MHCKWARILIRINSVFLSAFAFKHSNIGSEKYFSKVADFISLTHLLFLLILQRIELSETPIYHYSSYYYAEKGCDIWK